MGRLSNLFFVIPMNLFICVAGMLMIFSVSQEFNSIETRVIVSLSGAFTTFTKSYGPSTDHCWSTLCALMEQQAQYRAVYQIVPEKKYSQTIEMNFMGV
jgi:hypothetical protein